MDESGSFSSLCEIEGRFCEKDLRGCRSELWGGLRISEELLMVTGKRWTTARQRGRPRAGGRCRVFIGSNLSAHVICCNHQGFYFNNFLVVILNIVLHDIRDHYSGAFFQNFLFVGILDCFRVGLCLIMLLWITSVIISLDWTKDYEFFTDINICF